MQQSGTKREDSRDASELRKVRAEAPREGWALGTERSHYGNELAVTFAKQTRCWSGNSAAHEHSATSTEGTGWAEAARALLG